MFEINGKYQASVFVKTNDMNPTPEVISELLKMFRDKELLPTTFQEISNESPIPAVRLRLNSQNKEWVINFSGARIDIEKNPTDPSGKNLGSIEDFANDASDFFGRIFRKFHKKGHRLSLITAGILEEMNQEKLKEMYTKVFNPLPFYAVSEPFEWSSRSVAHSEIDFGEVNEKINVITNINRVRGQLLDKAQLSNFDRIEVAFDINTISENDENRFSEENLETFFTSVIKTRASIMEEIAGLTNE